MFTDKVDVKDFEKQDPEYQDLLRRVLAIQADCEIGGPKLFVQHILSSPPTKLDQLIVARSAAPIRNATWKRFAVKSRLGRITRCSGFSSIGWAGSSSRNLSAALTYRLPAWL